MNTDSRLNLGFEEHVREAFKFIVDLGFSEVGALPTLVQYRKNNVEVDIYHGRQSYEVGFGISVLGVQYSIAEIIKAKDAKESEGFRYAMTNTSEGVVIALDELSSLMKCYGKEILQGDSHFILILEKQRKQWSKEYSLEVLTSQLRPQANDAFYQKNYAKAADLFSQIRKSLTPSEVKKLHFSNAHKKIEYNDRNH